MKSSSAAAIVLMVLMFTVFQGCIKDKVIVNVNKDGSGTIAVTRVFTKDAVDAMHEQMDSYSRYNSSRGSKDNQKKPDMFFDEAVLKKSAKMMGAQVLYVKAKKVDVAGSQGYVAVYSFPDINEIYLSMSSLQQSLQKSMSFNMGGSSSDDEDGISEAMSQKPENAIEFKLTKGPSQKLKIILPRGDERSMVEEEEEEPVEVKSEEDDEDDDEISGGGYRSHRSPFGGMGGGRMATMASYYGNDQEAAAKMMMKGMQMTMEIDFEGQIQKTTASHYNKEKNRITLLNFEADKVLSDKKGVKKMENMSRYMYGQSGNMISTMAKLPGVIAETNSEVIVEYK